MTLEKSNQKQTPSKEPITIEDLAVMIERSFSYSRNEMNERFKTVDERFRDIEYKISSMLQNMATKEDIKELDAHIGRFERRFQKIEEIVLFDHRPRISSIEKKIGI